MHGFVVKVRREEHSTIATKARCSSEILDHDQIVCLAVDLDAQKIPGIGRHSHTKKTPVRLLLQSDDICHFVSREAQELHCLPRLVLSRDEIDSFVDNTPRTADPCESLQFPYWLLSPAAAGDGPDRAATC